jgi:hypothetical protein
MGRPLFTRREASIIRLNAPRSSTFCAIEITSELADTGKVRCPRTLHNRLGLTFPRRFCLGKAGRTHIDSYHSALRSFC